MLSRGPGGHVPPPLTALPFVALVPLVVPVAGWAQSDAGKRPLEIADYALWHTISGSQISDDGRWVPYAASKDASQMSRVLGSVWRSTADT